MKSCWPEPWSPWMRPDMPTRRSWSSTKAASTSRASARILRRRLVSGRPSCRTFKFIRQAFSWYRLYYSFVHLSLSSSCPAPYVALLYYSLVSVDRIELTSSSFRVSFCNYHMWRGGRCLERHGRDQTSSGVWLASCTRYTCWRGCTRGEAAWRHLSL